MLYLWTRLRLALWYERRRPSTDYLGALHRENLAPEWLYNPRDDRFSADIKFSALRDFLDRVIDTRRTFGSRQRGRDGGLGK